MPTLIYSPIVSIARILSPHKVWLIAVSNKERDDAAKRGWRMNTLVLVLILNPTLPPPSRSFAERENQLQDGRHPSMQA